MPWKGAIHHIIARWHTGRRSAWRTAGCTSCFPIGRPASRSSHRTSCSLPAASRNRGRLPGPRSQDRGPAASAYRKCGPSVFRSRHTAPFFWTRRERQHKNTPVKLVAIHALEHPETRHGIGVAQPPAFYFVRLFAHAGKRVTFPGRLKYKNAFLPSILSG